MSILSSGEQIAFNDDYKRYLDAEDRADARHVAIEDEVVELMKEGGECYPFTRANMFEALGEISDSRQNIITAYFCTAHESKGSNDFANNGVYIAIRAMVNEYWLDTAKMIATLNIDGKLS